MGQGGATGASQQGQGRPRGGSLGARGGSPPHVTRPREITPPHVTRPREIAPGYGDTPRPTSIYNQMDYITGGPRLGPGGIGNETMGGPTMQPWEFPGRRRGGRRGGGRWRAEHDAIRERLGVGPTFPNPPGGPPPPTPPYQVGRAYTLGSGGPRQRWAGRNEERILAGETGMRPGDPIPNPLYGYEPPVGGMMPPITPPPSLNGGWGGASPFENFEREDSGVLTQRAEEGFQQALAQVRHLNPEVAGLGDQEVLAWARAQHPFQGLRPGTTPIIGPQGLVQNGPIYGDRTINPANLPPTDLWGEVASRNSRLAGNPGGPLAMRQRNIDNWTPLPTPSFGDVSFGFGFDNITPPYPPGTGFGGGGYEVPPDFNVPSYKPTPTPSYGDQGMQTYGGRTLQDWLPVPANQSSRNTLSYTDGAGLRDHFGFSESQAPGRYVPAGLFSDWLDRDPRRQANIDNWSIPNYMQPGFDPFVGGGYGPGTGLPIGIPGPGGI